MKKRMAAISLIAAAAVALTACNINVQTSQEPSVGMANPWRDCTEEEAYKYGPNGFSAPEGATDVHWSLMLPNNDPAREYDTLVQMRFTLDGVEYTAREQGVAENGNKDISGIFTEWTTSEDVKLAGWAGGNMTATVKSCDGPEEGARLCLWYDIETGFAYSLSADGPDMSKVDIKAVAEAIYDPAKQIGANASEIPDACPEEATDEFLAKAAEECAPSIDIEGCDTFTQIVDTKLSDGMGYANEKIGGQDVLLVSSGCYDNLDGNMASIDVAIFMYKDGAPYEVGKITSGGTAYPLAVADDAIYAGSNHWVCKYTIKDDKLVILKKAVVEYDEKGNEVYYFEATDGTEANNADTVKTKAMFEEMFDEMFAAKIVNFDVVGGKVSKLPAYEYPGPEAFYTVLYRYLIDEYAGQYPAADVSIPCPVIIAEDESNKDDIKVWGNFWVFNYKLNGDTLDCDSGGSYPGCIHLKSVDTGDGYEVVNMEVVGDGSEFDPTAKKIFGKYYNDFTKDGEDTDKREEIRAQIIANYVAANDLNITAFKDYGWDPVKLPEENIDNFYSILD